MGRGLHCGRSKVEIKVDDDQRIKALDRQEQHNAGSIVKWVTPMSVATET